MDAKDAETIAEAVGEAASEPWLGPLDYIVIIIISIIAYYMFFNRKKEQTSQVKSYSIQ